jgi:hypothetical protein
LLLFHHLCAPCQTIDLADIFIGFSYNNDAFSSQMNGKPLTRDHGYPIRVVVPGFIGARSVKYLKTITIQDHESDAYFQKKDYKILPSHVSVSIQFVLLAGR